VVIFATWYFARAELKPQKMCIFNLQGGQKCPLKLEWDIKNKRLSVFRGAGAAYISLDHLDVGNAIGTRNSGLESVSRRRAKYSGFPLNHKHFM
jgi:hypothetical protein